MSTFQLEVGGNCANGARVVCLFVGRFEGVVLAQWRSEYVTWVFNKEIQDCTSHGNYFLYGTRESDDTEEEAYQKAAKDFVVRVTKYISH